MTALLLATGDDELLLREAVATLVPPGGEPPARHRIEATDPAALAQLSTLAGSGSLFGGGTLLVVEELSRLRGRAVTELLERSVAALAPGNAIALVDARSRRPTGREAESELAALVRRLGGHVVACVSPLAGELAPDLVRRARSQGREITAEAATELATRVGAELREPDLDRRSLRAIAVGELGKLLLAVPNAVGVGAVRSLVADRSIGSLLAFTDALIARDPATVARHLGRALDEPAPVVVAALHRRFRELALVAGALGGGAEPDAAAATLGLHPYVVRRLAALAGRWSEQELVAAFESLVALDLVAKGEGDFAAALTRFAATPLLIAPDLNRLTRHAAA